ncbi:glycosyltransferase family 4 protein [Usitatibacter palustris]|uniref:D-inositol-3-phosphate glycosyltransferase n=1 Tax=Usitatibacter palustris TaxID=2732487 RepID=A0A6M4HD64_9PROT|nr:glycosyltransferase family 4 protein [Usitatibacter palustris]QJR16483.1 D-inositol-3-phosphate glycosyltransferase [Usitatibacter palustris]
MNVLFVLYGDLSGNSGVPLKLHARELARLGHDCAVALPPGASTEDGDPIAGLRIASYAEALAHPASLFADGRPADILHAWTPREGVRRFVAAYLATRATPWVIYLEDNERYLATTSLGLIGMHEETILQHTEDVISRWTPDGMPHVLRHDHFIALADAAVVIQDKLRPEVPPWVPCTTVMPGTDLAAFAPRAPDETLRRAYGVDDGERVIVYPGGLNDFTRPGIESLCRAVGLINARGRPCRLLRSGPVALDFLHRLPPQVAQFVRDLGALPRAELPALYALADVFVQPGKNHPFEDLRLPGKLPELFASGRPVVLPDTNIASMLRDGEDALLHRTGSPEEIAEKCLALMADPERARRIGEGGRRFAEKHFDPRKQAAILEEAYRDARAAFDPQIAARLWTGASQDEALPSLVARRIRLLADAGNPNGEMLRAHASALEFGVARARGLEAGMAWRDAEMIKRDAQIEEIRGEVATRDGHITNLQRGVSDLNARVAELGHVVASRDLEIQAHQRQAEVIRSSLSWRVTRPLRALANLWEAARRRVRGDQRRP